MTHTDWAMVAFDLAVECQVASKAKYDAGPNDIVRDALFVLSHDAVITHRAVVQTVEAGWSSPAAAMTRTHCDILASVMAVVGSPKRQVSAYKYFYAGYRAVSRDPYFTPDERRIHRDAMRARMAALPEEDRPAASEFIKDKKRPYWFMPEWKSPSEVLATSWWKDLASLYQTFSCAAHGGFMGLRVFRDKPDVIDVNARLPVGHLAQAVTKMSTRVLLEICRIREQEELAGMSAAIAATTLEYNTWGRAQLKYEQPGR